VTVHTNVNSFRDHDLVPYQHPTGNVRYEKRPVHDRKGNEVPELYTAWIILDNQKQYNSYTTEMVKDVILAFRHASNEHDVVAVVFTAEGTRSFCTGGNTAEYAEHYAGSPDEYLAYMRLFNDMVSGILTCDKPVICRVNGMRIAGGQEIGMACDFTVASDMAVFGQAGPRHGSAPDGGSTDFLPLFVGIEKAMQSCTLCETWTAYEALRYGLITEIVPVFKHQGRCIPNPLVETTRWLDDAGRVIHGSPRVGEELTSAKALLKDGEIDLTPLDEAVQRLIGKLLDTFPGCTRKTIESVRKHKLAQWDKNKETNRAWLGLNMLSEAAAGFRAFNEGPRGPREIDFAELRQRLAIGERWTPELIDALIPTEEPAVATGGGTGGGR